MMEKYHPPSPRDSIKSPIEAVEKLKNAKVEHLYVFRNGKQFLHFEGENDNVVIENKYLSQLENTIVVHNHPGGTSFSIEDIEGVVKGDVKEIILVTKTHIHYLKRPENKWSIDARDELFKEQYEICRKLANKELDKLTSTGVLDHTEKEIEIIHYIWLFFFQLNGVEYVRKKNP